MSERIVLIGNDFVGGAYSNPLSELELYESNKLGDWGHITTSDGVNYYVDCDVQIGDGATYTYFIVAGKNIIFNVGKGFIPMQNSYVEVGSVWTPQEKSLIIGNVALIKALEAGRPRVIGTQIIRYDDDNVTEVARWNMLDKNGNPTTDPTKVYDLRRVL